ncbi:acyltransferase [Singulisphaera sp. Ch08]|uniref:Acyltransferase n=1 Tax=Singulisphaera sp. Ch08 TaxID=3120278 RepID=A0AAU7CC42_9BACT
MALVVAIRHIESLSVPFHWGVEVALFPFQYGLVGHNLFYVLSGFGLTFSMLRREASGRPIYLAEFLSARCGRLLPPYYAAMALYLIASWVVPRVPIVGAGDILAHAALLHSLWPETLSTIAPSHWSMSVIFQFYLVFPVLYVLTGKLGRWLTITVTLVAWMCFLVALNVVTFGQHAVLGGFLFYRLPLFIGGMEVARWYYASRQGSSSFISVRSSVVIAAGLFGISFAWRLWGPANGSTLFSIPAYAGMVVVALASADRDGLIRRILVHPLLTWLGTLSYSLYLTHELAFIGIKEVFYWLAPRSGLVADTVYILACLALAVVVSWFFYRLVELPLIKAFRPPSKKLALDKPVQVSERPSVTRDQPITA